MFRFEHSCQLSTRRKVSVNGRPTTCWQFTLEKRHRLSWGLRALQCYGSTSKDSALRILRWRWVRKSKVPAKRCHYLSLLSGLKKTIALAGVIILNLWDCVVALGTVCSERQAQHMEMEAWPYVYRDTSPAVTLSRNWLPATLSHCWKG